METILLSLYTTFNYSNQICNNLEYFTQHHITVAAIAAAQSIFTKANNTVGASAFN